MCYNIMNNLPILSIESLKKEFKDAEINNDVKRMSQVFHTLLELGFGGTNWRNEFDFHKSC